MSMRLKDLEALEKVTQKTLLIAIATEFKGVIENDIPEIKQGIKETNGRVRDHEIRIVAQEVKCDVHREACVKTLQQQLNDMKASPRYRKLMGVKDVSLITVAVLLYLNSVGVIHIM